MSRSRWAVVVVTFLVACGGDDGDDAGDATSTTTTTTTSDAPATTTTTAPADGPAEWAEVVQDVYRRIRDLYENPDPARVDEVFSEDCACFQRQFDNVKAFADAGGHQEGGDPTVLFVKVVSTDTRSGFVRLTVQRMFPGGRIVDGSGQVTQEAPPETEPSCESFGLVPDGPGGSYRVQDRSTLTGCPPEAG